MTARERDRLRSLQDRILKICDGRGYRDSMRVSADLPPAITLGASRLDLYPQFREELLTVLRELAS